MGYVRLLGAIKTGQRSYNENTPYPRVSTTVYHNKSATLCAVVGA